MIGSRTDARDSRTAPSDGVSPPNIKAQFSSTRSAPPRSALTQSSTEAVQISNWIMPIVVFARDTGAEFAKPVMRDW